jgi:hypothetical protein
MFRSTLAALACAVAMMGAGKASAEIIEFKLSGGGGDGASYYFDATPPASGWWSLGNFLGAVSGGYAVLEWGKFLYAPHLGIYLEAQENLPGNFDGTPGWHFEHFISSLLFDAPATFGPMTVTGVAAPGHNHIERGAYKGTAPPLDYGNPDTLTITYLDSFTPPTGFTGALLPEPATWAMMLLGFGGLGTVLRRQRRGALAA